MYYTHHEKTTLPIQDIFVEHFYIWGHSFSLGQILCGINLKLYFRGNFICGETFFSGNLKSLFLGQILFWVAFFRLVNFVYGKSEIFILGSNFLFEIYNGAFF